ncbi:helix-turn-helix domain-containing protein [Pseudoalteromonas luteoviolacea]|uniref:HTH araC/xylS-type domain-containing protein n=1 Tax=Pseudoalteromonas luteoviolacea NCIMB 1942 TaxID=1365253 RepID=A0A167CNZ4_9GAMM|nr:AraC family transcriptional regulator [Pseudoalteromonas luteoviolacea]KZN47888.1 hypothetical protein N482_01180 [Pseudoalteromonas luteoviolacea NCIMB 1942]KZX02379.1 hypothetical protein JL49_00070 [Pseudoalteromonas luteoviolacea]
MHTLAVGEEYISALKEKKHGTHSECVLTFLASGSLDIAHRRAFKVSKGMFSVVPPGVPHSLIKGLDLHVLWLSFCPDCLDLTNSELMASFESVKQGALPAFNTEPSRREFIRVLFYELMAANKQGFSLEVQRSFVVLLLNELNRAGQSDLHHTHYNDKVIKAMTYIQANYLQPIGLKEVSEAVHVSAPYLAALFKKETEFTVGQWITQKRLSQACLQLLHTSLPISQLAEQLGWSDTTHFIRQFKKHLGQTPAAWRRSCETENN